MKKKIIAVVVCLAVFGSGYWALAINKNPTVEVNAFSKEATVNFGRVTSGITESGSITIDNLSQEYDLFVTSTDIDASVNNSNSNSSNNNMGGMGDWMNMGNTNTGSTDVSTSSSTTEVSLVIDKIFVAAGKTVNKGDELMSITQESIDEARAQLQAALESAQLALTQAKMEEESARIEAKYTYDTRIAEGLSASKQYQSQLDSISNTIAKLENTIAESEEEIEALEVEIAVSKTSQQISQLEMQLSQAQNTLSNAQSQLTSAKNSESADRLAAKQTYDQTMLYYNNARSLYDIEIQDIGDTTAAAEEEAQSAKDDLAEFEEYVQGGVIKAEYSGTISTLNYSVGDTLSTSTAIAEYADAEAITVSVSVTEDDIAAVNLDDLVDIEFLAYPGELYSGYVYEIGSSITSGSTVSYPVTVVITSVPETVFGGMTANVTFIKKQVTDVLYVSNKAIITEGSKSYVKRLREDGNTEKTEVKTGFSNGTYVEITEGLEKDDTVIIESKVSG